MTENVTESSSVRGIKGIIFDLDGTVYLGKKLIPDADGVMSQIRAAGLEVLFFSNKPLETPGEYATKLTRLGIPTEAHQVLNSTVITVDYLRQHAPNARVFTIGEAPLLDALESAGTRTARMPSETDIVLISLDRRLTYEKIHFAYHAARQGATLMATNPDLVCPTEGDDIVDAGAWIAALEALLKRPVEAVLGKPSTLAAEVACSRLGLGAPATLMVGDRLETDIRMGRDAGMMTALVLTGVTSRDDVIDSEVKPDHVLDSISGLPGLLGLPGADRAF